ncbi:MAG: alpha/beta hydrolase [Spirochaetaceae bacterium]|nr:MAG: alpha/beta hydrolase [Spirochaetaceae bacterium]
MSRAAVFRSAAMVVLFTALAAGGCASVAESSEVVEYDGRSVKVDSLRAIKRQLTAAWSADALDAYIEYFGFPHNRATAYAATAVESSAYRLFLLRLWPVERAKIGRVLVVHGYMGHSGHHAALATALLEAGYEVFLLDLPGHGLSSGAPNTIDSFASYSDAVEAAIRRIQSTSATDLPLLAVGHSTGASALLDLVVRRREGASAVCGMVFAAPLVRIRHHRIRSFAARTLLRRPMRLPIALPISSGSIRNPAFRRFVQAGDPLLHPLFDPQWLSALDDWSARVQELPVVTWDGRLLVLQGTSDNVVAWRHNTRILGDLFPDARILLYQRYPHTILNEAPAHLEPVIREILDFLTAQVHS